MRFVAAVIAGVMTVAMFSNALGQDEKACRTVQVAASRFVETCGQQLRAFSLSMSDFKRSQDSDIHGHFSFVCPIEPMCVGEPIIGGSFVAPDAWLKGAKDERAIYQALVRLPPGGGWRTPDGGPPPMPFVACAPFDITIDGMAGRAVCFEDKGTKSAIVALVAADEQAGFLLSFSERDQTASALRKKVLEIIPRFKVERATGDVALLKWFK